MYIQIDSCVLSISHVFTVAILPYDQNVSDTMCDINVLYLVRGHAVAQLVEALCYKLEDRGLKSR
jgi:hypothetical protein